jgi:fatty-acyl-CoA synthase
MRNFFTSIPLKNEQKATPEEFIKFCNGKIARHKIPKYWEFVGSYPITAGGKIQQFKMKG